MPLGLCTGCRRAYIFDSNPQTSIDHCPHCGAALRPASVKDTRDTPSAGEHRVTFRTHIRKRCRSHQEPGSGPGSFRARFPGSRCEAAA